MATVIVINYGMKSETLKYIYLKKYKDVSTSIFRSSKIKKYYLISIEFSHGICIFSPKKVVVAYFCGCNFRYFLNGT